MDEIKLVETDSRLTMQKNIFLGISASGFCSFRETGVKRPFEPARTPVDTQSTAVAANFSCMSAYSVPPPKFLFNVSENPASSSLWPVKSNWASSLCLHLENTRWKFVLQILIQALCLYLTETEVPIAFPHILNNHKHHPYFLCCAIHIHNFHLSFYLHSPHTLFLIDFSK